jgi:hypothetical protein
MVGGEFGKSRAGRSVPFARPDIFRSKEPAIVVEPYPALFAVGKLI